MPCPHVRAAPLRKDTIKVSFLMVYPAAPCVTRKLAEGPQRQLLTKSGTAAHRGKQWENAQGATTERKICSFFVLRIKI